MMSNDADMGKAPPPGPMLPLENDSLANAAEEMARLRARVKGNAGSLRDTLKTYASAFALPPVEKKPAGPKLPQQLPKKHTLTMSNIIPVDANGRPKNQPAPERKQIRFEPAEDGTFVKFQPRPRPGTHPVGRSWTQQLVATHLGDVLAIVPDESVAKLVVGAINVYLHAIHKQQMEETAAKQAAETVESEAAIFEGTAPAPADAHVPLSDIGASASDVGGDL